MVTSSKVLTVSYGTFSCTLEGFEDPFTTLQMVAEYFRKLAAEDRYFGGIPRTPDTETLKQIARKATSLDVDADVSESGIVLRQSNAPAPEAEADSFEADETVLASDGADEETTLFRSRRQAVSQVAKVASAAVAQPEIKKSVEATLAAIRQNVENAGMEISDSVDKADTAPEIAQEEIAQDDVAPLVLDAQDSVEPDTEIEPETDLAQPGDIDTSDADAKAEFDRQFAAAFKADESTEQETVAQVVETIEVAAFDDVAPVEDVTEEPVAGEVEQAVTQAPGSAPVSAPVQSSLSPEQEAELARDLELAMQADEPEVEQVSEPVSEADQRREQRRQRAESLRGNDDLAREEQALERLLVTTQNKMDKPEQQRRINALDQLKAAVAATEAEQKVKKIAAAKGIEAPDEDAADLAAYREDLRRAQSKARQSGRGGADGLRAAPPPLILVSEQRIAEPSQTQEQVEPRREVAESNGNLALKRDLHSEVEDHNDPLRSEGQIRGIPADAFSESTTFAEFADRIGAIDMVDLLEAAAAYTSIVEGQSRFSRAQAMSKIAKIAPGDTFSKEAGLRAFGKLLREGKILRVQDGQFAISKASRFSVASRFEE